MELIQPHQHFQAQKRCISLTRFKVEVLSLWLPQRCFSRKMLLWLGHASTYGLDVPGTADQFSLMAGKARWGCLEERRISIRNRVCPLLLTSCILILFSFFLFKLVSHDCQNSACQQEADCMKPEHALCTLQADERQYLLWLEAFTALWWHTSSDVLHMLLHSLHFILLCCH